MKFWIKQLLVILILFQSGCGEQKSIDNDKIKVVVSILPYADFVENIGGEKVDVNILIPPNENPHTFEPAPSIVKHIESADIIFKVGGPFHFEESFFNKYSLKNKSTLIVECSEGIKIIEQNPHMWLSIINAKKIVNTILNSLIKISPENKNYFYQRYEAYNSKLTTLESELHKNFEELQSRTLMVFHPAWTYFAEEFNLSELSIEHEGKNPKAKTLKELIDIAKSKNIKAIFVDSRFDISPAETIAKQLNIEVSFINPLPKDYITNMKNVSSEIMRYNK
jgi:zinc transport system substrate-binding protein